MKTRTMYEKCILRSVGKLGLRRGEKEEKEGFGVPSSVVDGTYAVSKLSDEIIEEIMETTESGE